MPSRAGRKLKPICDRTCTNVWIWQPAPRRARRRWRRRPDQPAMPREPREDEVKRSKRLQPVGQLMDELERESALRVAAAQTRLGEAQHRCRDLQRDLDDDRDMVAQRAKVGMGVSGMRDYQTFIARLSEAVQAQQSVVEQLTAECQREREVWFRAAADVSGSQLYH